VETLGLKDDHEALHDNVKFAMVGLRLTLASYLRNTAKCKTQPY